MSTLLHCTCQVVYDKICSVDKPVMHLRTASKETNGMQAGVVEHRDGVGQTRRETR